MWDSGCYPAGIFQLGISQVLKWWKTIAWLNKILLPQRGKIY